MTNRPKTQDRRDARAALVAQVQANPGPGRPTDYDPAFCEVVIEAGRAGKSRAEIAAELNCSRQSLDNWAAEHPDFLEALQIAHDLSLAWWEAMARTNVDQGTKVNSTLWSRSMSGRFPAEPYRERTEVSGPNGGPMETRELGAEMAALPREKRDTLRAAIQRALKAEN